MGIVREPVDLYNLNVVNVKEEAVKKLILFILFVTSCKIDIFIHQDIKKQKQFGVGNRMAIKDSTDTLKRKP
jgi:hypothetical protein